ncbi:MAG TPA: hypothetical protein H9805_04030 [Candidatus Janibacter merdipullorum]|nr:hypothetical protein [Candidatus Janibacter merdipullorum]
MTQETMWKHAAEARAQDAGTTAIDIDEVMRRGRSRVRRRRVVRGGLGAALATVAVAGAVALTPLGPDSDTADPAGSGSPRSMAGCTLQPSTCDGEIVTRWMEEDLDVHRPSAVEFSAVTSSDPDADVLPEGSWQMVSIPVGLREGQQQASMDVLVAPAAGDSPIFEVVANQPDREWEERVVEIRPGITAEVSTSRTDGDRFEMWAIREGRGHGAVVMTFEGSTVPKWSDDTARLLLDDLLTGAPSSG